MPSDPTARAPAEPRPAGQHPVGVAEYPAAFQQRVDVGRAAQQCGLGVIVDGVAEDDHGLDVGPRSGLPARDAAGDEPRPVRGSGQPDGSCHPVPQHLRPRTGQRGRRGVSAQFGADGRQRRVHSSAQKCLIAGSIKISDGRGDLPSRPAATFGSRPDGSSLDMRMIVTRRRPGHTVVTATKCAQHQLPLFSIARQVFPSRTRSST